MTASAPGSNSFADARHAVGPGVSLWERCSLAAVHVAASFLLTCLSLRGLYLFGRLFGTVEWLTNYKRRRRFAAVLQSVLGRKPTGREKRRTTREHFMRSRCDKLFYLIFDRIPRDKAMNLFTIGNQSLLDQSLARGRGVYLAMSHHGPHHVLGMFMAMRGYKSMAVRDRNEGAMRRFVQLRFDQRYRDFDRPLWIHADSYPREIYRRLREGFVLGSAMDVTRIRNPRQKAHEVTVFGEPRLFLTGPLRIALKCHTPVLQAFIVPGRAFRYHLDIVALLVDPDDVRNEAETIAQAMATYAANVEAHVRAAPSLITRA